MLLIRWFFLILCSHRFFFILLLSGEIALKNNHYYYYYYIAVLSSSSPNAPSFSIGGEQHKNSKHFIYLGSNLSFPGDLTNEIQRHINLASSTFGHRRENMFCNRNHTIHYNHTLYVNNSVVISTILYGCDAWVPYCRHIRLHESFHITHLQLIPGLSRWNKVTHS